MIDLSSEFWHSLVGNHRERLQSLSLQARQKGLDPPICRGGLATTSVCFTALTTLELSLSILYLVCSDHTRCREPWHTVVSVPVDFLVQGLTEAGLQLYEEPSGHRIAQAPSSLHQSSLLRQSFLIRVYCRSCPLRHSCGLVLILSPFSQSRL
jgi:hypothetical protein